MRRGEGDRQAVEDAARLAREGHIIGIFPEGTRRAKGLRKKHRARPHTGAARIALAAGVPLVPVAIWGTERLTRLRRWHVAYGPPVAADDLAGEAPPRAAREATRRLWESITSLEAGLWADDEPRSWAVYPRLRLDIRCRDLLYGLLACFLPLSRGRLADRLERGWSPAGDGLACLSVRSGLDLLLEALELPGGSEVLVSAVTHPDMARILEAHGLVPVPVDLDLDALAPGIDLLEGAVTPRTRAVLVAHLFGGRADLEPVAGVARRNGLLLIEDCAQSLRGAGDTGDPLADVSLFSFGAIKTATALGGALVRVRDPETLRPMREIEERRPVERRLSRLARVVKLSALAALGRPVLFGAFARACRVLGRDLDSVVTGAVRGFPRGELLRRIRRRPSAPLLALLVQRLRRFDEGRLAERGRLGEYVAAQLPPSLFHPGREASSRTHWVFPVVAPDVPPLISELARHGFDASRATSSIAAVPAPAGRPELEPADAVRMLESVVFLPVYPEVPQDAVERMLRVLRHVESGPAA